MQGAEKICKDIYIIHLSLSYKSSNTLIIYLTDRRACKFRDLARLQSLTFQREKEKKSI